MGEKVPSTSFTSPHLLLPSFLSIHRSDKAGRPSGSTALSNELDLGMRGELVKDNHALRGPLKRSAVGEDIFASQFCSSLMGSRGLECSGYQRSQSGCTGDSTDKVFPINKLNIPTFWSAWAVFHKYFKKSVSPHFRSQVSSCEEGNLEMHLCSFFNSFKVLGI